MLKSCKKLHPERIRYSKRGVKYCANCPTELGELNKELDKLEDVSSGSCLYTSSYDIDAIDYYQEYRETGELIEVFQQYKKDKHILENPPRHKEIDEILSLLKKTGIRKITITRL